MLSKNIEGAHWPLSLLSFTHRSNNSGKGSAVHYSKHGQEATLVSIKQHNMLPNCLQIPMKSYQRMLNRGTRILSCFLGDTVFSSFSCVCSSIISYFSLIFCYTSATSDSGSVWNSGTTGDHAACDLKTPIPLLIAGFAGTLKYCIIWMCL